MAQSLLANVEVSSDIGSAPITVRTYLFEEVVSLGGGLEHVVHGELAGGHIEHVLLRQRHAPVPPPLFAAAAAAAAHACRQVHKS